MKLIQTKRKLLGGRGSEHKLEPWAPNRMLSTIQNWIMRRYTHKLQLSENRSRRCLIRRTFESPSTPSSYDLLRLIRRPILFETAEYPTVSWKQWWQHQWWWQNVNEPVSRLRWNEIFDDFISQSAGRRRCRYLNMHVHCAMCQHRLMNVERCEWIAQNR